MYKDIFVQLGLTNNESIIYEYLLKTGENSAGEIIKNSPLKRGVIYNTLTDLEKKGLISQKMMKPKDTTSTNVQKIAYFSPNHPEKLRLFLENQEDQVKKAKNTLESNLPEIISSFNLVSGMPGMRIFEGREGLIKVLNDSLSSKTEILTYADIAGMEKYLKRDNDKYVEMRKKLGIKKRGIVTDSSYAKDYLKDYDKSVTEIRFIDNEKYPMSLEMEIYDNKISFMTFSDKQLIGVIIENEEIYKTQKYIFEMIWDNAKPID